MLVDEGELANPPRGRRGKPRATVRARLGPICSSVSCGEQADQGLLTFDYLTRGLWPAAGESRTFLKSYSHDTSILSKAQPPASRAYACDALLTQTEDCRPAAWPPIIDRALAAGCISWS